ncbi:hypothetical protein HaLaN_10948, partial [Haematococcus lacustris]
LRRSEVVAANGSAEDPVRTSWSASIGAVLALCLAVRVQVLRYINNQ